MTTRPLVDIDADLRALACSDGSCIIARPKGMHTNGGCHCLDDMLWYSTSPERMRELHREITQVLRLYREREEAIRMGSPLPHQDAEFSS